MKAVIEACGIAVRSIAFEEEKNEGKQTAIVRFHPLPLPWRITAEELAVPVVTPLAADAEAEATAAVPESTEQAEGEAKAEEKSADDSATVADQDMTAAPAAGDAGAVNADEAPEEAATADKAADDTAAVMDVEVAAPEKDVEAAAAVKDVGKKAPTPAPAKKERRPMEDGRRVGDAAKMSRYCELLGRAVLLVLLVLLTPSSLIPSCHPSATIHVIIPPFCPSLLLQWLLISPTAIWSWVERSSRSTRRRCP